MDERTFNTLELPRLVELVARHVSSPLGRTRALSLVPSTSREIINSDLDRTTECTDYFTTGGTFGLGEVADPRVALEQLRIQGTSLDPKQVLEIQTLLSTAENLREQFTDNELRQRYPRLAAICSSVPDLRRVLKAVQGKVLPNGEIDDNASPTLRKIRREINERRGRIYRSLESLMRERAQPAIQDEVVTVRNGRFVIPIRSEARGQVPGVMHGLSSSGQTTYVEPLTIIDQNNELVRSREQEEIEIAQILFDIAESLRSNLPGIEAAVIAVSEIDFAQAKARLSLEFHCTRPEMGSSPHLLLEDARHPLLEHSLRTSGSRVVPISFEMDEAHQTLVISGPNAGGKTVVTKTVGLLALMAQMGLHVPARRAVIPVFQQILADIGDQQSIAANLSTFTAHMKNIAEMAVSVASDRPGLLPALILIDEVGTGTDPDEGAALGIAIVDYFRRAGATTIATTHYNPLKVWASQHESVLNASVEFDERTLRPTYRLIVGVAGASSGIEIARRMDVPVEIIEDAANRLDPATRRASDYLRQLAAMLDEVTANRLALEEERQVTADKYAQLESEFARREAERKIQFQNELNDVIREFSDESLSFIREIRDKHAAIRLQKEREARLAQLRKTANVRINKQAQAVEAAAGSRPDVTEPAIISKPEPPPLQSALDIHERDRVRLRALGKEGVVESIAKDEYTVVVGSLRFRARLDELERVEAAAPPKSEKVANLPRGTSADIESDEAFETEINVIGSTADETTDRVDKFLDRAYLSGAETVRIIHGHGKGTLRNAVAALLRDHPHVQSFGAGAPNQGGAGATVVVLKR